MTAAKKTTASKAATDKAAETKVAPAPVDPPVEPPVELPVEPPTSADGNGKVEVICLHEFNDLAEGCRRHVGDRFEVAAERAEDILAKHSPALIAVIGGGDE